MTIRQTGSELREVQGAWFSRAPVKWSVCKLGFRYAVDLGKMLDEKQQDGRSPMQYLRNQDVQWDRINTEGLPTIDIDPVEIERYTVRDGDLLVCEGGDVGRAAIWSGGSGSIAYQKALHRLRPRDADRDEPRFLFYSLMAAKRVGAFDEADSKATISHLPADKFRQFRFAFPPREQQRQIAVLLDRETARIDALIEKKTRFIELLREKRQAVIAHAIGWGVRQGIQLNDSGDPWLGSVPKHWRVTRLKRVVESIGQGWSPECDARPPEAGEWGVVKVGCVNGGVFRAEESKALPATMSPRPELALRQGDVLVSRANTRDLVGSCAVVPQDFPNLMLCDKLYRIQASDDVSSPFLAMLIAVHGRRAVEVEANGASASMVNVSQEVVMNLPVALPTREEQDEIVTVVGTRTRRLERLISVTEASVALLAERRATLITAAVTGQIDLRDAA